jgi:hypothetical protein
MYPPLLQQLLLALACGGGSGSSSDAAAQASSTSTGGSSSSSSSSVSCRSTLLGILSSSQPYPAVMVLRLLVSILHNRHISLELLAALNILPRRAQQQHAVGMGYSSGANGSSSSSSRDPKHLAVLVQALLSQLQGLNAPAEQQQQQQAGGFSSGSKGSGRPVRSSSASLLSLLTQQYLPNQLHALVQAQEGTTQPAAAAASSAANADSSSSSMQGLEAWLAKAEEMAAAEVPPGDAASAAASSAFSALGPQLLAALLQLLQQPELPAQGLRLLGWLLHQLLPVAPVADSPVEAGAPAVAAAAAGSSGLVATTNNSISHPLAAAVEGNDADVASAVATEQQQLARQHSTSSSAADSSGEDSSALADDSASIDEGTASRTSSMISGAGISTECDSPTPRPPVSSLAPSASFRSGVGQELRGALLTSQQQQQLQAAVDAARGEFRQQLHGMWCEAVFPMLAQEWPVSREVLQRPVLRAGSDALLSGTTVWPLLQALQAAAASGGGAAADALSVSGKAALACYLAVQRVVALTQLQEVSLQVQW